MDKQILEDYSLYGVYIEKDGKRIDPKEFYMIRKPEKKDLSKISGHDIASKKNRAISYNQALDDLDAYYKELLKPVIEAYEKHKGKYIPAITKDLLALKQAISQVVKEVGDG